jgi:hypothetical protein
LKALLIQRAKKKLRDEREKKFELVTKLSQFEQGKSEIEHNWETITKEPSEMDVHYDSILCLNLKSLRIYSHEFNHYFTDESIQKKNTPI